MFVTYFSGESVLPQGIMRIDFFKFADSSMVAWYYNIDDMAIIYQ